MPRISGLDVCHAVKHELGLHDVSVVMLTAKGQGYDGQRDQDAGAETHVTKPLDPDDLLELAEQVLGL